ncbi:MAG: hypothetical protein IKB38_07515 [Clostridia bacterium]|nr:hypothetical protein [Clostridia bacterium]
MKNAKTTKRALISSVISLVICFTMLLGSTFAWFTDSAISSGNKIVTGNLDVELWHHTESGSTNITAETDPVFSGDIVWEPGKTEVAYFSIKNNGSLDLKYKVAVAVTEISDHDLTEVMYYAITPDAKIGTNEVTAWVGNDSDDAKRLNAGVGITETDANDVTLLTGEEHFFALSIHMDEAATNKYMGESITFDIKVLAGQLASEEDSFGKDYDKFAGYPGAGFAPALADGQVAVEIPVVGDGGDKVGSVMIPAGAAEDETVGFTAKISKSTYKGNFTVAAGMETVVYDVSVTNLKADNTAPVKAQLRIAAGLDPDTVKLYHYDTEIDCVYNPSTGYVTFETTSFSPFTVVFDADSEYVPAPALPENVPTANVTYYPDWVGADIEWGNFGGFAPTEGKEAVIDAAFVFECPAEVDEAYKNWLCDFYVSLDQDLGENEIFLAGQYGDYLVGFHNGELTLEAGTELPLLGAAISGNIDGITNWTYADVESFVGTFICGVGNVEDSLTGATFTVALRLINPDNTSEYYDVNVVTYTFGGSYEIK